MLAFARRVRQTCGMRTILPYLTPAMLAVIAALLGVIACKMPEPPEPPVTFGELRDASKSPTRLEAVMRRVPVISVDNGDKLRW